jgi:hypothetical protein
MSIDKDCVEIGSTKRSYILLKHRIVTKDVTLYSNTKRLNPLADPNRGSTAASDHSSQ